MQALAGFVALAIMAIGGYWMLAQGGGPQAAVLLILGGLVAYVGYRGQKALDRAQELESRLAGDKRKVYEDFITIFRETSGHGGGSPAGTNGGEPSPPSPGLTPEQTKRLGDFVCGSILIGSDDVVRAVSVLSRLDRFGDERLRVPAFADVLVALRKDVGYPGTGLSPVELAAVFITDVEDHLDWFQSWIPVRDAWRRSVQRKRA